MFRGFAQRRAVRVFSYLRGPHIEKRAHLSLQTRISTEKIFLEKLLSFCFGQCYGWLATF